MQEQLPVLVVGAGPVGLTAMAELRRRDVEARLIDQAQGPSHLTKALLVWPRTLEVLHQLGGARFLEEHGQPVTSFRYYDDAEQVCQITFGPATRPTVITQPRVEEAIRASIRGGAVEWSTTLLGLRQGEGVVHATLRGPDGQDRVESFSYVIGCDGAGSVVRDQLGLEFNGMTYPSVFILADAAIEGHLEQGVVHYFCSGQGVLVMVPLKNDRFRVFTAGPPGMKSEDLTLDMLQAYVDDRGPGQLVLRDVSWQTTFNIHARHTDTFQVDRVFLAGDAAHIHSPAGGQGLNTGVTDAHNLAWKLALVHRGAASPTLLSSYSVERSAVSAAVVKQASTQTAAWLLKKPWQIVVRNNAARLSQRLGLFERHYTPWLAGLVNHYPDSVASTDSGRPWRLRHDGVRGGRLVPNVLVRTGAPCVATDDATGAAAKKARPLREALPPDRYTVLVWGAIGAMQWNALHSLARNHSGLVTIWSLARDGELTTPTGPSPLTSRADQRFRCALVRPDHYVAVCDASRDLTEIHSHLAAIATSPSHPLTAAAAPMGEPVAPST
ncbi:MAG TPA: FAD-dependent monooxygenase [Nocardioides sp.]|nr:FAD-dependent monooxygenase [Nocardioides sp.]